jgi:hypothetical protein
MHSPGTDDYHIRRPGRDGQHETNTCPHLYARAELAIYREPVLASLQALRLADLVLVGARAGQRTSKLVAQTEPRSEQGRFILERANEA